MRSVLYDIAVCLSVCLFYVPVSSFLDAHVDGEQEKDAFQNVPSVSNLNYLSNSALLEYKIWNFGVNLQLKNKVKHVTV